MPQYVNQNAMLNIHDREHKNIYSNNGDRDKASFLKKFPATFARSSPPPLLSLANANDGSAIKRQSWQKDKFLINKQTKHMFNVQGE